MNEIAKMDAARQIVVADPFDTKTYHATPDAIIVSMHDRQKARRAEWEAVDKDSLPEVRAFAQELKDDDAALLKYEKALREALLDLSGFKSVVVQMRGTKTRIDPLSVRGAFGRILGEAQELIDAAKEPEEAHDFVIRFRGTDTALMAAVKALEKNGADCVRYELKK